MYVSDGFSSECPGKMQQAIVGVCYTNRVIFNIVDNDADFFNTGLSIIHHLKSSVKSRNNFISAIIESQAYDSIKDIFDDEIIFGNFYSEDNENTDSLQDILKLVNSTDSTGSTDSICTFKYMYIYDVDSDKLFIKLPELENVVALDYKKAKEVKAFAESL